MKKCLNAFRATWMVYSVRREFAQALYQHYANGRDLPSASGRLRRQDYDRAAAKRVTWALRHYIR